MHEGVIGLSSIATSLDYQFGNDQQIDNITLNGLIGLQN
jgi:hypothetical protein